MGWNSDAALPGSATDCMERQGQSVKQGGRPRVRDHLDEIPGARPGDGGMDRRCGDARVAVVHHHGTKRPRQPGRLSGAET